MYFQLENALPEAIKLFTAEFMRVKVEYQKL